MKITWHGKRQDFVKGVARHNGQGLVFFGDNVKHVQRLEREWLLVNMPASEAREKKRPSLRVIEGGKRQLKA